MAGSCKGHLGSLDVARTDEVLLRLQVIVFSFSKKECEALALQMAPLDLNDESEHKLVEGVFWNAVDSLSEDDRRLPQVARGSGSGCLHSLHITPKQFDPPDRSVDVLLYGTTPL